MKGLIPVARSCKTWNFFLPGKILRLIRSSSIQSRFFETFLLHTIACSRSSLLRSRGSSRSPPRSPAAHSIGSNFRFTHGPSHEAAMGGVVNCSSTLRSTDGLFFTSYLATTCATGKRSSAHNLLNSRQSLRTFWTRKACTTARYKVFPIHKPLEHFSICDHVKMPLTLQSNVLKVHLTDTGEQKQVIRSWTWSLPMLVVAT